MMVICKKHGGVSGTLVSPELAEKINHGLPISKNDYVRIDYEFDGDLAYTGDTAYTFYLSSETAARFGFTKSEKFPLSLYDEHPEPFKDVKPSCFKCFQELLVD